MNLIAPVIPVVAGTIAMGGMLVSAAPYANGTA